MNEVSQFRNHKSKNENKAKSQKELERTILRDINQLKTNLREKLTELIERGFDLDEIFYEMREDEELKYEKQLNIDLEKSALAKHVKFRCLVGL